MSGRCILCAAAGLTTMCKRPLCHGHYESLRLSGRAWCNYGQHVVQVSELARSRYCVTCDLQRKAPRPAGYIRLPAVAARLYVHEVTLRSWFARGWPVERVKVNTIWYVREMAVYPPPPADPRKGVRKRAELGRCAGGCGATIPTTSDARYCDACRLRRYRAGAAATNARRRAA